MSQTPRPNQLNNWRPPTNVNLTHEMATRNRENDRTDLTLHHINTILSAPSAGPIPPYTMYPLIPIRFLVGPSQMPFDIHASILTDASLSFTPPFIASIKAPLPLPNTTPETFNTLILWLYTRTPPLFTRASDLQHLCELWVVACHLGIFLKANTLLRLGMELMTPVDRVADFATARWVFGHTVPGSPLRGIIVAVLAQRSQAEFGSLFREGDAEIWKARNGFMRGLERARKRLAFGVHEGDGGVRFDFGAEKREGLREGEGELPMPEFLVWDERGEVLPDRFFVFPGSEPFEEGLVGWLKGE